MRTRLLLSGLASSLLLLAACPSGTIVEAGGDSDGTGGDSTGDGDEFGPQPDAAVCDQTVPVQVTQVQKTPDVLLVVDKSGSMGEPLGGAGSKMNVMKNALGTVLPAKDAAIHFGLMLYPSDDVCGPGTVVAPVATNGAAGVMVQLNPVQPQGATPTYAALGGALAYYNSIPVNPDGRFVLLATDGLPNCNGNPNNPSNGLTLAAASGLAAAGIKVFVIGFGDVAAADPVFLQQLAVAGGTSNFFPATTPADLEAALTAISGTVTTASCSFALGTTPADPTKLGVTLDGAPVVQDPSHQQGWDYDPATNSIIFYGDTCDAIQSGMAGSVGVDYGCGGPVIG